MGATWCADWPAPSLAPLRRPSAPLTAVPLSTRAQDGSGDVLGAGDDEHISRRGGSDVWNPNLRSEFAEITFGHEAPTEAMKDFYSRKIPIPASMRRSDGGYSLERSLIGAVVFGEGDAAKFGGRLGQVRKGSVRHAHTTLSLSWLALFCPLTSPHTTPTRHVSRRQGEDELPNADAKKQLHAAVIDGTGNKNYQGLKARELRSMARSSAISFGGGHSLPGQHEKKARASVSTRV